MCCKLNGDFTCLGQFYIFSILLVAQISTNSVIIKKEFVQSAISSPLKDDASTVPCLTNNSIPIPFI